MEKYNNCKIFSFKEKYGIIRQKRMPFLRHKGYAITSWEYGGGKKLAYIKKFIDTFSISNYEIVYYTSRKNGLAYPQIVVATRTMENGGKYNEKRN